ncbi:MAG: hypothetical protein HY788_08325 [Deltaproteobacteria bacterium]|nr:hypothetical protein [Deltaproteobacteria bacterium]
MNLFDEATHWISTGFEMLGIGIIVSGAMIASTLFLIEWKKRNLLGGKTKMTLRHSASEPIDEKMLRDMEQGWNESFDSEPGKTYTRRL